MRLNMDCIRDTLLYISKQPLSKKIKIEDLYQNIPGYNSDEIYYSCIKLIEAGYLSGQTVQILGNRTPHLNEIYDITYQGHEFLNTIEDETIFHKTKKKVLDQTSSFSLELFKLVAFQLTKSALNL